MRSYEDAATAIGRLDSSAKLASAGARELLVLRCIATPAGVAATGMIALVRADGEGDATLISCGNGFRTGAARARGGGLPSVAALHELLGLSPPPGGTVAALAPLDQLFRDAHERTPPVLKAACAAYALGQSDPEPADESNSVMIAALATTLVLCVGGAITDAWLTMPRGVKPVPGARNAPPAVTSNAAEWIGRAFVSLARDARLAERALAAAREQAGNDERRVREAFGRAAYSALDVLALMRDRIVITVPETARALGLTPPTAGAAVARLVELGIAREVTGKARSRAFTYDSLVRLFQPEFSAGD